MFEQPDNITLASYILHEIVSKMPRAQFAAKHGIEWEEQIVKLEETTTLETLHNMKSLVGAFDHAAVVGTCLASGWLESNVPVLLDDENPSGIMDELGQFSHLITEIVHKKVPPIRPVDKRTKEQLITQGFLLGLDLGRCLKNITPYAPMSGLKLREMLETVKKDPELIKHGKKPFMPTVERMR